MSGKGNQFSMEVFQRTCQSTAKTSCVVLMCVSVLEILMLCVTILNPGMYREYLWIYRGLYLLLLVASLLFLSLFLYARRDLPARYRVLGFGYVISAVIYFAWVIAVSYFDSRVNGVVDTTAFMTFSLAVPLSFYLTVPMYLMIGTLADLCMIGVVAAAAGSMSTLPNLVIFCAFQLILGASFIRIKENLNRQIIDSENKNTEVEELSRAQSHFFSNMSHEIRTPINTIIGLNEMILRENASPEINEDAENIQSASRMLLHLINDILDMSKIESGQMHLNETAYKTGDMLSDVVGMMWIRAREKKLEFHVDVASDLPTELLGDEVRIKQILINVLNNAIKYTNEGSVWLSVHCDRDGAGNARMYYSVRDTGIGIKKESIPYLFTAFKRVDEDKTRHIEGTGLGLSIVKQMVDMMHGNISVNSIYTKGSTFVIEIPQRIVDDSQVGELDMGKGHGERSEHVYVESFEAPKAKVLVVDDTAANLMVVTKLLKGTKLQIDTASSGEEALRKTQADSYHVILMDHKMPGMDGIECTHAIRSQMGGLCHDAKIVALTANAGSEAEHLYANEGFDGYLVKPVTGEELEASLFRMLPHDLVKVVGSAENFVRESTAWLSSDKKKVSVKITTESVADLPVELIKKYNIAVLPHLVRTEHGLFKDGLEIDTRGLLPLMENGSEVVLTQAPDKEEHERFFSRQIDEANHIIHISISGKMNQSGCLLARQAADSFGNVHVIDSEHLSSGQGLLAIEGARLAADGKQPEEIIDRLEQMREHVHTSFVVDSLDFLARQKQISENTARLASAMMVHPVLTMKKGTLTVSGLYFGSRQRAWRKYINAALDMSEIIDRRMLFITYVGMKPEELQTVKNMVAQKIRFDEVYCQQASPAIAANSGPGTFGLLYFTKY